MKTLIMTKDRKIEYTEYPEPYPENGFAIIDVKACGICGTDMHVFKGMDCSWSLPGIIGHEFAGIISDYKSDDGQFVVGDKVTIQPLISCMSCEACKRKATNLCGNIKLVGGEIPGAFAEKVKVPVDCLIRIPDSLPVQCGALAEPAATAIHAVSRLRENKYKTAVIFGAGAIGLLILCALKGKVDKIIVSDIVEERLSVARSLGASFTVNAKSDVTAEILKFTDGEKIDLAVDAAGFSAVRQDGFKVIKAGGEFLFVALGHQMTEVDFIQLVTNELSFYGSQCHTKADFSNAFTLMENGTINYDVIVKQLPLSQGAMAFSNQTCGIKLHLIP